MSEERYEAIDIIVKCRDDGKSWFDVIHDYITQDCDSIEITCEACEGIGTTEREISFGKTHKFDCDACGGEGTEWTPCQCCMESMGGMSGTSDQCYAWKTNLGQGLQPIDVARALVALADGPIVDINGVAKVVNWARKEIEFEETWDNWTPEEDDE